MSVTKSISIPAPLSPTVHLWRALGLLLSLVAFEFALLRWWRLWDLIRFVLGGGLVVWDFQIYYAIGYLAREGLSDQIYNLAAQEYWVERLTGSLPESSLGFVYPPFFALALSPLSWLSHAAAFRLWFGLNGAALALLGLMLWRLAAPAPRWQRALLLASVVSSDAVYHVVAPGQVSAFLVLVLGTSLLLLRRGHDAPAGVALALMTIKPQLVVGVLLLLALRARWRALLGFALTAGALTVAPLPFLGPQVYLEQLQLLASQTGADGVFSINYAHMHSWRAFLASFDLDRYRVVYFATFLIMTLATLVASLWAWRTGPARGDGRGNQEWALALLFPLLLTPHLWTQELLLLGPVGALALSQLAQAPADPRRNLWVAAALIAGYVILSEAWNLTRRDVSLTIFVLVALLLWTCLRRWGAEQTPGAQRRAIAPGLLRP